MRKIVLLYTELIPSVRLCGYEQFSYLAKCGLVSFEAVSLRNIHHACLEAADAVVFVRGDSYFENCLAKKLKTAGKYLIYVLDDDLLNVPEYISSAEHYRQASVVKQIRSLMQMCDCLLTPSERLAQKYGSMFDTVVLLEEPALKCVKRAKTSGPVKIGFAGSVDRALDFERILAQPLRTIQEKFGDAVAIEFFGAKPSLVEELNCRCFPYVESYAEYQEIMEKLNWDIGLAPMPDTEFHACKHYNKFIEYGSYGIISVCSSQMPYTRIVRNWENGVLCSHDASSWESSLTKLICELDVRNKISENLHAQIQGDFLLPKVSMKLWRQLDVILPQLEKHRLTSLLFCYAKAKIITLIQKIIKYGWRFPIVVWKKIIKRRK